MEKITTVIGTVLEVPEEVAQVLKEDNYTLRYRLESTYVASGALVSTEQFFNGVKVFVRKGVYSLPQYLEYYSRGAKFPSLVYLIEKNRNIQW